MPAADMTIFAEDIIQQTGYSNRDPEPRHKESTMAKTTNRKIDVALNSKKKKVDTIPGAEIELGDQVVDIASGFQGVCTGLAEHLHGCPRVHIDPLTIKDDGSKSEGHWFDMQGVAVLAKQEPIIADNAWTRRAKKALQLEGEANKPGGDDDILNSSKTNHSY